MAEVEKGLTIEILPESFGDLTSQEAPPILERASRRIDILHVKKNELWQGIQENIDGARGWIEANGRKLAGKTVRAIAGGAFVVSTLSACAGQGNVNLPTPTETFRPTATEVLETSTKVPTETPTQTATPTEAPTPTEVPIQVGMPEKFEDIQVVKEEDLDAFMPRLLEAEKAYVEQDPEKFKNQRLVFAGQTDWDAKSPSRIYEPYDVWGTTPANFVPVTNGEAFPVKFSSWTKVEMNDGTEMYILGIPGKLFYGGKHNGQMSEQFILHFLYNPSAVKKYYEGLDKQSVYNEKATPEAIFQTAQKGQKNIFIETFADSASPNQPVIDAYGWQASGAFLEKNDKDFDFTNKLKDWTYRGIDPGTDFIEKIQTAPLPMWLFFY